MMAAGLPLKTLFSDGREPTSMAFFSAPGIERLYSGVTNSSASAAVSCVRRRCQAAGVSASRSWL